MRTQTVESLTLKLLMRSCRRQSNFEDLRDYIKHYNAMVKKKTILLKLQAWHEVNRDCGEPDLANYSRELAKRVCGWPRD